MKRMRTQLGLLFAAAALSAAVCAEGLNDPTRPPAGFDVAASGAKAAEHAPAPLVLESVLIHPDSRTAIISGERLTLGQKIRGLRLVRIGETEVVLLDGGERRTLKLYPGVQKKPASPADGAQPGG
jgi:MSHA biogenesis protein MshK